MSKESSSNSIGPVTAGLLAAYHEGRLSPQEAHALEMAALDDPMLAEALEGLEEISAEALQEDLGWIEAQIDQAVEEEKKVVPLVPRWNLMRVAAAVILLCVAGVGVYWLLPKQGDTQMAMESQKVEEPTAVPAPTAAESADTAKELGEEEDAMPAGSSNEQALAMNEVETSVPTPRPSEPQAIQAIEESPEVEETTAFDFAEIDKVETESGGGVSDVSTEELVSPAPLPVAAMAPPAPQPVPEEAVARAEEADDMVYEDAMMDSSMFEGFAMVEEEVDDEDTRSAGSSMGLGLRKERGETRGMTPQGVRAVSGIVKDENGEPLPGVTVQVPGLNQGAVSDLDGNFVVLVPTTSTEVRISYVGYESKILPITGTDFLDVELDESTVTLSKVVVESSRPYRVEQSIRQARVYGLTPSGGFEAYYGYLIDNLDVPGYEDGVEYLGSVKLHFVVDVYGVPNEVRVSETLGLGLENQLVRLVKQGPDWMPANDGNEPIAKSITLELPIYR